MTQALHENSFTFRQKMTSDDLYSLESNLINKSMRELTDGSEKDPLTKLRLLCLSRGGTGILGLGRAFRNMHADDSKAQLNEEEFSKGIKDFGLDVRDDEIKDMFKAFDENGSGSVSMTEFLLKLRPPMSQRRVGLIDQAFAKMDKSGDGVVTVNDMKNIYSVKEHPKYQSGEMSKDEIFAQFWKHFGNGRDNNADGPITKEEFINYYAALSASIEEDSFFDLMIRCAYRL